MRGFVFHDNDRLVAHINVPNVNGHPPAHLYPQVELEHAMENALRARGVKVEYCRRLSAVDQDDAKATATVCDDAGNIESIRADWLIAADGGHSDVRSHLGIPFPGRDYPERWSVAEIRTEKWPPNIQAQLFLKSNGVGLFLSQPYQRVVQGILNAETVANELLDRFPDAQFVYERAFNVALRRVLSPRQGRVWLIGDAAHVQSPVGGQGLSLAIWDGLTLAKALVEENTAVERALRRRARLVLGFTDFDYRMLSTRSPMLRSLRNAYWSFTAKFPQTAKWFFKLIAG
jgi:2-polyprenyl-6-methoxyphenol hydroxylase-like FAD-dependent oxidoreductase